MLCTASCKMRRTCVVSRSERMPPRALFQRSSSTKRLFSKYPFFKHSFFFSGPYSSSGCSSSQSRYSVSQHRVSSDANSLRRAARTGAQAATQGRSLSSWPVPPDASSFQPSSMPTMFNPSIVPMSGRRYVSQRGCSRQFDNAQEDGDQMALQVQDRTVRCPVQRHIGTVLVQGQPARKTAHAQTGLCAVRQFGRLHDKRSI